ncbi:hypothetical protein FGO68_gene14705 [Halteria grandinella]|uniref:Uncharacterized protein n=1 Tax=Halteria grandinella TaxID=5974 RepID=A0A8J8T633_HALGN|nr:hypothetical protein FGO68_gene14705 [Halteria grandinella]
MKQPLANIASSQNENIDQTNIVQLLKDEGGWYRPIQTLNLLARADRTIEVVSLLRSESLDGELALENGQYYGQCLNDSPDGVGIMYCISNKQHLFLYEGLWKDGNLVSGRRIMVKVHIWEVYEGEFANQIPHGFGFHRRSNKVQYVGHFKNSKYDGEGRWENGQGK